MNKLVTKHYLMLNISMYFGEDNLESAAALLSASLDVHGCHLAELIDQKRI